MKHTKTALQIVFGLFPALVLFTIGMFAPPAAFAYGLYALDVADWVSVPATLIVGAAWIGLYLDILAWADDRWWDE